MKQTLVYSVVLNILLLLTVVFIGARTHFFHDVAARFGWVEKQIVSNQKADDCLRGWTRSLESLHDTVDVVFLGNSITHGGDFDSAFPNKKICNLGYPSDNIEGMSKRVNQVKSLHPAKVFILGGYNQLDRIDLDVFSNKYEHLIEELARECPETRLFALSILPVNQDIKGVHLCSNSKIGQANTIISKLAHRKGIVYIDLYSLYLKGGKLNEEYTYDGVHLKADAYRLWYEAIKNYVEQ